MWSERKNFKSRSGLYPRARPSDFGEQPRVVGERVSGPEAALLGYMPVLPSGEQGERDLSIRCRPRCQAASSNLLWTGYRRIAAVGEPEPFEGGEQRKGLEGLTYYSSTGSTPRAQSSASWIVFGR